MLRGGRSMAWRRDGVVMGHGRMGVGSRMSMWGKHCV
jgi:hypothetical protein